MRTRLLFAALLISLQLFAQEGRDSTEIANLLIADYKTTANLDVQAHIENCTDQYLLIASGEFWDMAMEIKEYKKKSNRKIVRKDDFIFSRVRVFGETAYAVYYLSSDITENGKRVEKSWTESAFFRKLDGKWKIELINSTPFELK